MIVRYALKCDTCGKPHTMRIGMGHDASQTHNFLCRECSEEIVLRMELDHENLSWSVVCVENRAPIDEVVGAPVVYVDANFVISPEHQGEDRIFRRNARGSEADKAIAARRSGSTNQLEPSSVPSTRLWCRVGYAAEGMVSVSERQNQTIGKPDCGGVCGVLSARPRARKP